MRSLVLLLVASTGCASTLPALDVAQTVPAVDTEPGPVQGRGQVVVDAVDAPNAHLDEVVGRMPVHYGRFHAFSTIATMTHERCSVLPCVLDVPRGESELDLTDGTEHQLFRVDAAPDKTTFVRARLPEHHVDPVGILGWTLAGIGLAPLTAGPIMIAADPGSLAPAGTATLLGGVALAVVGIILGVTHPNTVRPGTVLSW